MTWNDECQHEIDRLLATQDLSEVVTHAVSQIVEGSMDGLLVMLGHGSYSGCDPKQTVDFGQRLLAAAIDELRGKR